MGASAEGWVLGMVGQTRPPHIHAGLLRPGLLHRSGRVVSGPAPDARAAAANRPGAKPPSVVNLCLYRDGRRLAASTTLQQLFDARRANPGAVAWVGLYRPSHDDVALLAREFDLHELAVEDAITAHQRPKLERYGDTLFVVLHAARYLDDVEEVEFGELHVFVGPDLVMFDPQDAELLIVAATLHDIGYSARIAHTGFHPLDGTAFLRRQGYPERLVRLVAHHSLALMTAPAHGIADLAERFPREDGLLADALAYADRHSAPDGQLIQPERRLAGIAARHPDREHADRADQLRAAIARVETALIAAATITPRSTPPVPVPRIGTHPARTRRRRADHGALTPPGGGDRGRPGPSSPLGGEFRSWWFAESQYALALDWYQPGTEDRAAAMRLARLRARADQRRDRYFRAALV